MIKSGQLNNLPETSGVYLFRHGREILYIGKATSLRSRVRSYLNRDILQTRGEWIARMIRLATRVDFRPTDSVLEALILEAALIKKYQPQHNAKEKDDTSFNYAVITKEKYPRVLLERGRRLSSPFPDSVFGPFPHGREIKIGLKILRKIFPFRDNCVPESGKPCFNAQIGLCPGVCAGQINDREYRRTIRRLKLFLGGKKKQLLRDLERQMKRLASEEKFEQAGKLKRQIFALRHIQDVALVSVPDEPAAGQEGNGSFRVEAYDAAHLAGRSGVGVMVVLEGEEFSPSQYRRFRLRRARGGDDLAALAEIIERRANHPEWPFPDLVVFDGGRTQLAAGQRAWSRAGLSVAAVAVVKDEKHRAREILGERSLVRKYEPQIIRANHEAHRFALGYHRQLRSRLV